ncbi:hypothetical protein D9M68_735950 [compost metagenome]
MHGEEAAQGGGLDFHLDQLGGGIEAVALVERGVEAEPGAQGQDDVGLLGEIGRHRIAARPDLAGIQGMLARDRVAVAGGHGDRRVQPFGKRQHGALAEAVLDAAAGNDQRPFRLRQHLRRLFQQRPRRGHRAEHLGALECAIGR